MHTRMSLLHVLMCCGSHSVFDAKNVFWYSQTYKRVRVWFLESFLDLTKCPARESGWLWFLHAYIWWLYIAVLFIIPSFSWIGCCFSCCCVRKLWSEECHIYRRKEFDYPFEKRSTITPIVPKHWSIPKPSLYLSIPAETISGAPTFLTPFKSCP